MKTPLQEAISHIKEYRESGNADLDTCNVILLHLASMLDKEKEMFEEIIDIIDSENSGLSAEQRLNQIEDYIKTFNTKEQ